MKWQNESIDNTLKAINSNYNGLSSDEARRRIDINGKNELIEKEKPGLLKKFLGQLRIF